MLSPVPERYYHVCFEPDPQIARRIIPEMHTCRVLYCRIFSLGGR